MKYKSYATIENDEGKVVQEAFDMMLEREGYVIIDKEKYAQDIINKESVRNIDDCDIRALVEDYISEDLVDDIVELILEMRCYE